MKIFLLEISLVVIIICFLKYFWRKRKTAQLLAWLRHHQSSRILKINESKAKYLSNFDLFIYQSKKELILNSDATTLLELLNTGIKFINIQYIYIYIYINLSGQITSQEILLCYYSNAISLGISHNGLAEINIEYAYKTALCCDATRSSILSSSCSDSEKRSKLTKLGFLYGLPISLKEPFITQNLPATQSCIQYLKHIYTEDGLMTRLLKAQGAIPFITSNVPQVLLINETMSRCYGRALNPWNKTRTPGGSSGGEAVLIACKGSPLGIGSDDGGSIRIPSNYTGLYGFTPTSSRVGSEGHFNGTKMNRRECENSRLVCGPIGKSVNDLALVMRSLICEELWQNDFEVGPVAWREELYQKGNNDNVKRKLKIGYNKNNTVFPVAKGNQRVVQEAIEALKSKGYEVEEFNEFPFFEEIIMTFMGISTAEGGLRGSIEKMGDEPPIEDYDSLVMTAKLPKWTLGFIKFLLKMMGEKRNEKLIPVVCGKSAWEYFQFSEKQQEIKGKFSEFWRKNKLDGFICPGSALPALKHQTSNELFLCCCYNFVWNFLGFPVGAVPISKIQENEEEYDDPVNRDRIYHLAKECCKGSKGLPVGVQVSTLPYKDELCLFLMKEIEEKIKFKELPVVLE